MPTDVALLLTRKAETKVRASKELRDDLIVVCLWAAAGLVLVALMSGLGFDIEIAKALITAG